jgi:hypothetical protein
VRVCDATQVYGLLDTPLLIEELSRLVGGRVRALAHETHFSQFSDLTGGRWGRFVRSIGAVPATARNFYRLLRAGGPVLLFPGGPSEVCRRRGERNVLRWRDEADFVRPAARLDAIIVPFSSAGADDAVDLLIDGQEMQRLPVVGPALTRLLRDNNFDPEQCVPRRAPRPAPRALRPAPAPARPVRPARWPVGVPPLLTLCLCSAALAPLQRHADRGSAQAGPLQV